MKERQAFTTSADVRKTADYLGSPYFSRETMKFFNSRLLDGFWPSSKDRTTGFIVVSNQDMGGLFYDPQPREYNVVEVTWETKDSGHLRLDFNTREKLPKAERAKQRAAYYAQSLLIAEEKFERDAN